MHVTYVQERSFGFWETIGGGAHALINGAIIIIISVWRASSVRKARDAFKSSNQLSDYFFIWLMKGIFERMPLLTSIKP